MPRWPGPLLIVGGALLTIGALAAGSLVLGGELEMDRATLGLLALAGVVLFVVGLVYSAIRQIRVRRFLPPERYRGPAVLILLALVLVVASVANAPFGDDVIALLDGDGELTLAGAIVILVSTQVALLLVAWIFVHLPGALAGLPSLVGRDPGGALRSGVGWGLLAWLGSKIVIAAVAWVLERVGLPPEPQTAERAIVMLDPVLVVLALVILTPIAEEVFFRGVVFNAWLREGGRRWAYIGSAALFAVIHLSLVSLLPIFLLGLALAWIYRRTGSLLAPIAMHATVNGISVALALLVRYDIVRLPV
ncbi:MAG TPA: type II CAAX endopeptidase family protein [Candidatus Binatia bacterium]|nr:type II CAAX endopeptidase family protein [Candidatus Binatia bacterium]